MGRAADRRSRGAGRRSGPAAARRGTHAQPRRRRSGEPRARIGWSRRLGVVAALLVAGVSVVFAGQALGPQGSPTPTGSGTNATATASLTAAVPAAPELQPVEASVTSEPTLRLRGRLVDAVERETHRLRIYVNGELHRERRLPRRQEFELQVPLVEGLNAVTLALRGPRGEGLHSAPVEVTLDTQPPAVTNLTPASGSAIYGELATLQGSSEPGATLRVTNAATQSSSTAVIGDDGALQIDVGLAMGANEILLETRDAAGNTASASVTLERRHGEPSVELSLSRTNITVEGLPTSLTLVANVRDAAGQPIDGAEATFSLSPPGMPTLTFNATTQDGVARWQSVRVSDVASVGEGLATVLVVLPDGTTLTANAYFTISE